MLPGFSEEILDLFRGQRDPTGVPKSKELWRLSFLTIIWKIWKERNSRCLMELFLVLNYLVEKVELTIPFWGLDLKGCSVECYFGSSWPFPLQSLCRSFFPWVFFSVVTVLCPFCFFGRCPTFGA